MGVCALDEVTGRSAGTSGCRIERVRGGAIFGVCLRSQATHGVKRIAAGLGRAIWLRVLRDASQIPEGIVRVFCQVTCRRRGLSAVPALTCAGDFANGGEPTESIVFKLATLGVFA